MEEQHEVKTGFTKMLSFPSLNIINRIFLLKYQVNFLYLELVFVVNNISIWGLAHLQKTPRKNDFTDLGYVYHFGKLAHKRQREEKGRKNIQKEATRGEILYICPYN